jgi:four helix bundle protein
MNSSPVYRVEERFNLADQLRRAAVSVPLNIAEGAGSAGNAEFGRFLSYAYRSLKETITALELCPATVLLLGLTQRTYR